MHAKMWRRFAFSQIVNLKLFDGGEGPYSILCDFKVHLHFDVNRNTFGIVNAGWTVAHGDMPLRRGNCSQDDINLIHKTLAFLSNTALP